MKSHYKIVPQTLVSTNRRGSMDKTFLPFKPKYKHVWQSARLKLKIRLSLNKIIKAAINDQSENQIIRFNMSNKGWQDFTPRTNFPKIMIHPENIYLSYWNIFIGITIIYSAIFMPYLLAFPPNEYNDAVDSMDKLFSGLYFLDFLINCNVAFYSKIGNLIINRKRILLNYLKGWMLIDIFTFIPFDLLILEDVKYNHIFKLARIPRLYKILKISKVLKWLKISRNTDLIMKIQDLVTIRHAVIKMLFTFSTILLCVHIVGCMWCFIAKAESYRPESWIRNAGLIDANDDTLYLTGIYWAFTTFSSVGYGDISASTDVERIFSMIWMICSMQFLGITIATLSNFLSKIETRDKLLLTKLSVVDEFATQAELKKSLRLKMRKALRQSSTISGFSFTEKISLLYELPKSLRFEVALAMHRGAAKQIHFFRNKDDAVISAIVPFLSPMFIDEGEFVYESGFIPDEFYFVVQGKVMYMNPLDNHGIYMIKKREYFGDIEIMLKVNRKFSAISRARCEFLVFSLQLLSRIKKLHPYIWNELKSVAKERNYVLERSMLRIDMLRGLRRTQSKSEAQIAEFQTFQKIKRDMKNANFTEIRVRGGDVTEEDVVIKIAELEDKLGDLKKRVDDLKKEKAKKVISKT